MTCSFNHTGCCDCQQWIFIDLPIGMKIKIGEGFGRCVPRIGAQGFDWLEGIGVIK